MALHINPQSPLAIRDESGEVVVWVEPPATLENDSYLKMTKRAADFVRVVNCHDELVSALETARESVGRDIFHPEFVERLAKINAALSKARVQ